MRSKLLRKSLGMSAVALLLLGNSAWAEQVLKYSVRWDVYTDRYRVYMRPVKTPSPDQTLTSQLTIRVPHFTGTSRFTVSDLRTAVTNTTWSGDADESRVDAPTENPTKDYISFELSVKGSDRGLYAWKAGKEQEVFSFTFGTAGCKGLVEIMPDNDPFDPKNIASGYNSSSTNPGNQFTNLGWGTMLDNNYLGVEGTAADCTQSFDTDGDGLKDGIEKIVGTDPNNPDTDGDGKKDGVEVGTGTTPLDTDGDGKIDALESVITDTDKDGVVDELDPDNANACIPSAKAATCDQDGDGTPNASDTDDDGDGVADTTETALGTDPNDADSDNVNTSTVNEGTTGTQTGKSASDDSVTDTDGDGKTDAAECLPLNGTKCKDTDGDGKYDWQESALTDTDKDGVVDELDPDNANACIPSAKAATCDQDGDGTPNASDTDDDGDGVADTTETALGTDPNDADSDNVNTSTVNEGTTGTQTGKSASDDSVTDTDGDGKTDAAECLPLNGTKCKDTDGDGKYDWQESALTDTDKDGVVDELDPDNVNACIPSAKATTCDQDGDGTPNASDTDDDGDGVADTTETALGTDPNDADSDNVNTSTVNEGTTGTQTGKSASDDSVTDTDGDGKTDAAECLPLNGTKCKDTDGDGKYDWQESALNDADGDGIKDELDPDDATPQNIKVQVKALLQGPFDFSTLMMLDTLRSKGLIPTAQPYNNDSFLYKGTEAVKPSLLTTTGTDAPVDWVLVELRNASTPANTVARKAALLQRDGDVMDAVTGDTSLSFDGVTQGNYYVAVRHRNHLGVMSAAALALSANATKVDFSKPSTPTWGTNARLNLDTNGDAVDDTAFLWSGNADMNSVIIASGPSNDTSSVLYNVWQAPGNTSGSINYILPGYLTSDFNLDGNTVYSGRGNDINVLLANVLLHPGNVTLSSNYIIRQQLP